MRQTDSAAAARQVASIDYPLEGELVFSPHYTVRVKAPSAKAVEVSFDAGPWQPCRFADGHWWHDWNGYSSGSHVVAARIEREEGGYETLRPRAFRVALQPAGQTGLQHGAPASGAVAQALWTLRQEKVQFVQLWFCDVAGKPWRIGLPISHITEDAFTSGVTLDGPSTAKSFQSYITLLPDPTAIFKDPLATVPTAALMCDLIEPPDVAPSALGVRQVLQKAHEALGRIEPGLTATLGAEPEFFLLNADGEPAAEQDTWDFICDLARTLQEAGIPSEGFRYGPAKGQGRVQMKWTHPVRTADHVVLYRWFASVLAKRRGKVVTWAPRPEGGVGAGIMAVHTSLWVGSENVFHDEEGWELASDKCLSYAAGVLAHCGALSAIVAPTESSYPLVAGAQCSELRPMLSRDDNTALLRVPSRLLNPSGRRLKFRAGAAHSNPYLTFAALLLAGTDGLKRSLQPEIETASRQLPQSLDEALQALDDDRDFLKDGGFTDRLIDAWMEERRSSPETSAVEA